MGEQTNQSPPAPPRSVLSLFKKAGAREYEHGIPGAASWWKMGGHDPVPWPELVEIIGDDLVALRQMQARLPAAAQKSFHQTSEFWMSLVAAGAGLTAGLTQITTKADSLPEPWGTVLGGGLMLTSTVLVPAFFTYARSMAKKAAEAEAQKLLPPPENKDKP